MKKVGMLLATAVVTILLFSNPVGAAPNLLDQTSDPGLGDLD